MPFSEKQLEFFRNANHRWNFKTGATRSGKTYMDYFLIPKRIRARVGLDGLNVILGVSKSTIERNILEPMRKIWPADMIGSISSDNTCMMFGEKVHCLGAEKVSQVAKLRGSSIKYCYCDEVADYNEDVFSLLKSRLDKPYSLCDGALNPEGPNHWFKKFLDSDADIYNQHYTIFDNPFLAPKVVSELCKEYAGSVYYRRYILGEWALAEGLVYPMFSREKHVIHEFPEYSRRHSYYVSVDYGTVNPFAAGLWDVDPFGQTATMIRELYYDGHTSKRVDNEAYYSMLAEMIGDYDIEYIIIDPSASSMIETINKHGEWFCVKADNDVLNSIQDVTKYLNAGTILFHDSCENTFNEFEGYSWDEKRIAELGEDVVAKTNDHSMDQMRYFVRTALRNEL